MSKQPNAYQLQGQNLKCPRCDNPLEIAANVTPGTQQGFRKGMLTVCGHCAGLLTVGDSGFQPLFPAEFDKLPEVTKRQLRAVQEVVKGQIQAQNKKSES